MGVARNGRGVAVAVVTVGLIQSTALPSVAHAGFLDFLFGQPQARTVRPYEGYPGHMPAQWGPYPGRMLAPWGSDPGFRRHAGHRFRRHEHKFTARRKLSVADETDQPGRPPAPPELMDDDSLRPGDAVMTASGIRIFVGDSGTPHAPEDFRKPSEIKRLPKRERKALAALDAQGSSTGSQPGITTGRSASERKLVFGETIIDPQGRSIRYVGP
ncbi:MAG: hypothetical protein ACREDD_03795 [Methylocella sp.]